MTEEKKVSQANLQELLNFKVQNTELQSLVQRIIQQESQPKKTSPSQENDLVEENFENENVWRPLKSFLQQQINEITSAISKYPAENKKLELLKQTYQNIQKIFLLLENYLDDDIYIDPKLRLNGQFVKYLGKYERGEGFKKYNVVSILSHFIDCCFNKLQSLDAGINLTVKYLQHEAILFSRYLYLVKFLDDLDRMISVKTKDNFFETCQHWLAHNYFVTLKKIGSHAINKEVDLSVEFSKEAEDIHLAAVYGDIAGSLVFIEQFRQLQELAVSLDSHAQMVLLLKTSFCDHLDFVIHQLAGYNLSALDMVSVSNHYEIYNRLNLSYRNSFIATISEISCLLAKQKLFGDLGKFLPILRIVFLQTQLSSDPVLQVLVKSLHVFNNLYLLTNELKNLYGKEFDVFYARAQSNLSGEFFEFMQKWDSIRLAQQNDSKFLEFDVVDFKKIQQKFYKNFVIQFLKDIGRTPQTLKTEAALLMIQDLEEAKSDLVSSKKVVSFLREKIRNPSNVGSAQMQVSDETDNKKIEEDVSFEEKAILPKAPPKRDAVPLPIGGTKRTKREQVIGKQVEFKEKVDVLFIEADALLSEREENSRFNDNAALEQFEYILSQEELRSEAESFNPVRVFQSVAEMLGKLGTRYQDNFIKETLNNLIRLTTGVEKIYKDLKSIAVFNKTSELEQVRVLKYYYAYIRKNIDLLRSYHDKEEKNFATEVLFRDEAKTVEEDFKNTLLTSAQCAGLVDTSVTNLDLQLLGKLSEIADNAFNCAFMESFYSEKTTYQDVYLNHQKMIQHAGIMPDHPKAQSMFALEEDAQKVPLKIGPAFAEYYLNLIEVSFFARQLDFVLEKIVNTYSHVGLNKTNPLRKQLFIGYQKFCGDSLLLISRHMAGYLKASDLKKQLKSLKNIFVEEVLIPSGQKSSLLSVNADSIELEALFENLSEKQDSGFFANSFGSSKKISAHLNEIAINIERAENIEGTASPLVSLINQLDAYLTDASAVVKNHHGYLIESLKLIAEIDKYWIELLKVSPSQERKAHLSHLRRDLYRKTALFTDHYLWIVDRYHAGLVFWQLQTSCDEALKNLFSYFSYEYLVQWAQQGELLQKDQIGEKAYSFLCDKFSYLESDPVKLSYRAESLEREDPESAFLESFEFANNFREFENRNSQDYRKFYSQLRQFIENTQDGFYNTKSETRQDDAQPTGWIRSRDASGAKPLGELQFIPDDPQFDVYNYLQRSLQVVRGIDYVLEFLEQTDSEGFLSQQRQQLFREYEQFTERCLFAVDKFRISLCTSAETAEFLKQQEIDFNSDILVSLIKRCGLAEGIEEGKEGDYKKLLNYFRRRATLLDPARTIETSYGDQKTGLTYIRTSYPVTQKTVAQEETLNLINSSDETAENYHTRKIKAYQNIDRIFQPLMLQADTRLSSDDIHDIAATEKNTFIETDKIYKGHQLVGFRFFIRGTVAAYVGNGGSKDYRRYVRNAEAANNYEQIKLNLAYVLKKELTKIFSEINHDIQVEVRHNDKNGYFLLLSQGEVSKELLLNFNIQTLVTDTRINREDKVVSACTVVAQVKKVQHNNTPINFLSKLFGGNAEDEREIKETSVLHTVRNFLKAVNVLRRPKTEDHFFEFKADALSNTPAAEKIFAQCWDLGSIVTQIVGCFQGKDRTSNVVFASFLEFDNDVRAATGASLGANLSMVLPENAASHEEFKPLDTGNYDEDLVAIHSVSRHELAVTDDALPGSLGLKKRSKQTCFGEEHATHFHTDSAETEKKQPINVDKISANLKKPENQQQFVINVATLKNEVNEFILKRKSSFISKFKKFDEKEKVLNQLNEFFDQASQGELVDENKEKVSSVVDVMHQWLLKTDAGRTSTSKEEKELTGLIKQHATIGQRRWGMFKPATVEFLEEFVQTYKNTEIAAAKR